MALEFIVNESFQFGNSSIKKQGIILEVTEAIVKEEMKKGHHGDTQKPISGLLNHCSPYNEAAKAALKGFAGVTSYVEPGEKDEEGDRKALDAQKKEEIEKLRKEFDKIGAAYDPNWQGKRLKKELAAAILRRGESVPDQPPKKEKVG